MKLRDRIIHKSQVRAFLLVCFLAIAEFGFSQLNPFGAGYYQNQYLLNPALSGIEKAVKINLGYRREWNGIPGGPVNQYLTGEYGFKDKIGLGLNVVNDKAGVFATTRARATFSYHIPFDNSARKVHLGLSAGVLNRRIDQSDVNGDPGDPVLSEKSITEFDADFGAAYTDKKLTIQAAFPDMVSFFSKSESDVVNRTSFFAAVAYKLALSEPDKLYLEPKCAFRGVKGFDNIIDVGLNLDISGDVNFFGVYHSSKSATIGAGVNIKNRMLITAIYTTAASGLKIYTDGTLEFGLAISLAKNK